MSTKVCIFNTSESWAAMSSTEKMEALVDEVERLRAEANRYLQEREDARARVVKLEAENAELREVATRNVADCQHLRPTAVALERQTTLLRSVLKAMVEILGEKPSLDPEVEGRKRDQWHYARMLSGSACGTWDAEAAGRGEASFK